MSVDIESYLSAVVAAVKDHFGGRLAVVGGYDEIADDGVIDSPAVLIGIEGFSEGSDRGDDRVPLKCQVSAQCILSVKTENVQVQVRAFAAEFLSVIRRNKFDFGVDVSFPEGLDARPGVLRPGDNGYDSFEVTWDQELYLGESVWDGSGVVPTEVWVSQNPEIGLAHEPDYENVAADS